MNIHVKNEKRFGIAKTLVYDVAFMKLLKAAPFGGTDVPRKLMCGPSCEEAQHPECLSGPGGCDCLLPTGFFFC